MSDKYNGKLTGILNRKFTRRDLPQYNSENPTMDAMLVELLIDATINGAIAFGITEGGYDLVQYSNIKPEAFPVDLALYIATKGEGCEVYNHPGLHSWLEITDDTALVPEQLPGYEPKTREETTYEPWTWGDWLAAHPYTQPIVRDGRRFIGCAIFLDRNFRVTATECLALQQADLPVVLRDQLPAETADPAV